MKVSDAYPKCNACMHKHTLGRRNAFNVPVFICSCRCQHEIIDQDACKW